MRGKLFRHSLFLFRGRITPADAGKTSKIEHISLSVQDHPRGCGENGAHARRWCCEMGSPPRMRGKLGMAGFGIDTSRITPADAGKTFGKKVLSSSRKDHPRGCGENCTCRWFCQFCLGSPPRMRGKLLKSAENLLTNRITPADAGKTQVCRAFGPEVKDHPRGCGENDGLTFAELSEEGSPPRMRGKPV